MTERNTSPTSIIILAAGQGTRMHSRLPKVLHKLAGRPLLEHVCLTAYTLQYRTLVIVYGYGGRQVPDALPHLKAEWIEQAEQLGTGHAVAQALPLIEDDNHVLILYGDVPLITSETLEQLVAAAADTGFSLLTAVVDNPAGYGRIIRDAADAVIRIVEDKDASDSERRIHEINTGMMVVRADLLRRWIAALNNNNRQGEYYLTDILGMAAVEGVAIHTVKPSAVHEIAGINDRIQLAEAERHYQQARAQDLMLQGVTLLDPARLDLRGQLTFGTDVVIDVNVIIEGEVSLGNDVHIGANCQLRDVAIGDEVEIQPNCVIEKAKIGRYSRIGPFARIRPDTHLAEHVHVGNFVEVKKSELGEGSKVNHLSYIGDSEIGRNVNVGAGTITCNYDGANKHKTVIEDNVFIGSNTQLVAPVRVAAGATIGAGTTITRNVEAGTLAISRVDQRCIRDWKRPEKKE